MERQIGIRFEHEELAATIHYPNRTNEGERQRRVPSLLYVTVLWAIVSE